MLVYTPQRERAAAILEKLRAVPPADFEPRLAAKLKGKLPLKVLDLKPELNSRRPAPGRDSK